MGLTEKDVLPFIAYMREYRVQQSLINSVERLMEETKRGALSIFLRILINCEK